MGSSTRQVRVTINGYRASVTLHDCGDPAAPTILALHGFTGSGADFTALQQALGNASASWILPDFMGHGKSEAPPVIDPYQLPAALRLIDQARAIARDSGKLLLLAYSMGGRLALHYLRYAVPLPAILIGTSPGLDGEIERSQRREADRVWIDMMGQSMERFCEAWEQQPLIRPQTAIQEPFRNELASRRRGNASVGLANSLAACGTGVLPSLWTCLGKLPPVVLCHGSEDAKFREIAQIMQATNNTFRVRDIPASGHSPHLEAPEAMANLVREELDSLLYR